MSTSRPVFSAITPVYNGGAFVARCYQTLRDQDFSDWEWIVVNDGSTDNTLRELQRIDDPRVRIVSYSQNQGRGYARSRALEESSGEWIVIWDMDDLCFPDRLQKIYQAKVRGFDFCCSYAAVVDNMMRLKGVRGFHRGTHGMPDYFVHHTLGCRLEIARRIGYDAHFRTGEDATMTWVINGLYKGLFIEEALTVYQEEREISVVKAVATNDAQLAQLSRIYRMRMLPLAFWQYAVLAAKLMIKRVILEGFRLMPGWYELTVKRRSYGMTRPGYGIPPERLAYLKKFASVPAGSHEH